MIRPDGPVAFITGDGLGLGQAAAFAFASAGAAVGGVDIDGTAAEETAARIVCDGGSAHASAIDVASLDTVVDAA
jgi:NAD(P)-dependent dehydrogenase (short-subunit alcohol dehydrogenase family)